jgi:hypothetical protein
MEEFTQIRYMIFMEMGINKWQRYGPSQCLYIKCPLKLACWFQIRSLWHVLLNWCIGYRHAGVRFEEKSFQLS